MRHSFLAVITAIAMFTASVPAQTAPASSSNTVAIPLKNNPEMQQIFIADQVDRGNNPYAKPGDPQPQALDGKSIRAKDDAREIRVHTLLDTGQISTATDYFRAALIFQHAGTSDGYLLAHILAEVAVAKGDVSALWLSAATLDRYLINIHQKQVFGTQFAAQPTSDAKLPYLWSQQDFDKATVSDPLRSEFCVSPLAAQQMGLPGPPAGTGLSPCPAKDKMKARQK